MIVKNTYLGPKTHIMVFLLETSPGPLNEALGVNSLEGREKEHPELKKLRSPW